jgi:chemotaxis protein methyltransferase CheR
MMRLSEESSRQSRALIAERLGLDFPLSRQADLERGIAGAVQTFSHETPEKFLVRMATLADESPEWRSFAGALTVGETYFFRDRACLDALENEVLPALIAFRRETGNLRLRLWSAACASGEEPYTLAIMLDRLLSDRSDWSLTILATDIDPDALETARAALYRNWSFRGTPDTLRGGYFRSRGAETYELSPRIRQMVTFAPLNLAQDGYPSLVTNTGAMDVILCRNVLMYFTRDAQRAAVARLQQALVPGGWLLVSPSEASADLFSPLATVNFPGAIFFRNVNGVDARQVRLFVCETPAEPIIRQPFFPLPMFPAVAQEKPRADPAVPDIATHQGLSKRPPAPDPVNPHTLLQQARVLANQGMLEEARRMCEGSLAQERLNCEAYLLLAEISQELGERATAQQAIQRAIYLSPDFAPAHFVLGSILFQQEEHKQGRRSMETVLSLLHTIPRDEGILGADGLTAGRLVEMAQAYLNRKVKD